MIFYKTFFLYKKKYFFKFFSTFIIILIIIANYRYPFFYNVNSPWIIGYNYSKNFEKSLNISQNNIISLASINNEYNQEESIFLADPFFIQKNDTIFIFVENAIKNDNAVIDLFILNNGEVLHKGTILDPPFHISYPQVFMHDDQYYMLPETKRSNNVILFKATNFPYDWVASDTLIKNVRFKDATLLSMDELNVIITCNDDLESFVYCSNNIFEGWEECENYNKRYGNEVRPGGRIFNIDGKYFIPMQNLNKAYGTSLSLYEIIIDDKGVNLSKVYDNFIGPQLDKIFFNSAMHHLDLQKIENQFIYFYDGQNLIHRKFSIKRSVLFNLLDIKTFMLSLSHMLNY